MRNKMILAISALLLVASVSYGQAAPAQQGAPATGGLASSLKVFVYPAKGQEAAQQQKDEGECFAWSKQQTGIDPLAPAPAAQPQQAATQPEQPKQAKGGAVKGAAGGAVAGTAIGAIAGDTGTGAAIGATAGAMKGRRAQKKANKAAEQQAKQQQQQQQQQAAASQKAAQEERLDTFRKAFSACMEARNYTVR